MNELQVYEREIKDGLADLINSRSFCSIKSPVNISGDSFKLKDGDFQLSTNNQTETFDPDLYPLEYILLSTVWNENDDVFTPQDTFLSLNTSKNKPLNLEHEFEKIVGHSVNVSILDEEGKFVDFNSLSLNNLPEKFHVKGKSVIYQIAHNDNQQDKIDTLIKDIKSGKYFISVEALFPKFDYMLKSNKNEFKIIERNNDTCYLTKYLRIYNGSGVYGDYRIARVPRNIIFSGQAIVKHPANPESIIFAKKNNFLSFSKIQTVYQFTESKNKEVNKMDNDNKDLIASLQNQIKELNEKNNSLIANVAKVDFEKVKSELESKVAELKVVNDEVVKLKATLVEKDNLITETQKQTQVAVDQLNETKAKLAKIELEAKFEARANVVSTKLKISDASKVKDIVDLFVTFNDEQFNKYVDLQASLIPEVKVEQKEKLETQVEDLQKIEKPNVSTNSVASNPAVDKIAETISAFAEKAFASNRVAKAKFS